MSATPPASSRRAPGSARLGERVRQLRVAAGLTQTDLAGDRFSKEYVSQIERGKTRPTRETIEWLASSSASTPASSRAASPPTSASRVEASWPAPRRCRAPSATTRRRRVRQPSRRRCPRTGAAELEVRALLAAEAWARMQQGEVRAAIELLDARAHLDRAARVLGRRPRRAALPAGRLPLQAFEHRHRDRALQRGARSSPRAPAFRATCSARRSSLALALLPPPARLRSRARGRRARARARRGARRQAARSRIVYFQASLVAERDGPLGARPQLRGARERPTTRS